MESDEMRQSAAKCRRLAKAIDDRQTLVALEALAVDYEQRAIRIDERHAADRRPRV
jgi:hypothetical protein